MSNTCDAGTEGTADAPLGPVPWDESNTWDAGTEGTTDAPLGPVPWDESNTCDAGTEGTADTPLGPAPRDVSIPTSDADLHRFIGHQKATPKVSSLWY